MRTVLKIAAGVVLAAFTLTAITWLATACSSDAQASTVTVTSTHAPAGPSGGGWEKKVRTTDVFWKNVGDRVLPCRNAKVTIHKWGNTASFYDWRVWMKATACLANRGGMHIAYWHRSIDANVCQYTCDIAAMSFARDAWGCVGSGCTLKGASNTWKITRDLDLIGYHARWYPRIGMTWSLGEWRPGGAGNFRLSSSAYCGGC